MHERPQQSRQPDEVVAAPLDETDPVVKRSAHEVSSAAESRRASMAEESCSAILRLVLSRSKIVPPICSSLLVCARSLWRRRPRRVAGTCTANLDLDGTPFLGQFREIKHRAVLVGESESDVCSRDERRLPLVSEAKQERGAQSLLRVHARSRPRRSRSREFVFLEARH